MEKIILLKNKEEIYKIFRILKENNYNNSFNIKETTLIDINYKDNKKEFGLRIDNINKEILGHATSKYYEDSNYYKSLEKINLEDFIKEISEIEKTITYRGNRKEIRELLKLKEI